MIQHSATQDSLLPWLTLTRESLMQRFLQHSLHHGLLVSGQEGIGKRCLADAMMKGILCLQPSVQGACGMCQSCKLVNAGTHPDHHVLESEKQLGVDAIRTSISKLSSTPQIGRHKVLLIPVAEKMTEAASNALLKTLEEPTDNTYLFLLTSKINSLLPTILSRCEKVHLPVPEIAQSLNWLIEQGDFEVSQALLQAYGNAPLRVLKALQDENSVSFREFSDGLADMLAGKADITAMAGKWQGSTELVLDWCQQYYHDQYRMQLRTSDFERYQQCLAFARRAQHPGINKTLLLSQLFSQLVQA
ncbi:DNA polymerase III subunit delta' [Aestuariibacter sp. GS-14]|uniref:DNA polymerase III subunit delta' n=1 Tax=Aestuariibacter sp. GS-14 TaxID=2590670 RepID=UPI00112DFFFB|nr:DNA polymerase III subunit delta' [Aestuariibacter sp. GS-14]TPV59791.1 DNA polymerase III subunit delta' [Aestuariibacter sp. GS-14]